MLTGFLYEYVRGMWDEEKAGYVDIPESASVAKEVRPGSLDDQHFLSDGQLAIKAGINVGDYFVLNSTLRVLLDEKGTQNSIMTTYIKRIDKG